jgi:hypothetical protein
MAKQVAHEIKTRWLMRLTVQSFERKFNQETLKSYKNERLLGDIDSTNWHYECRRICFF